MSLSEELAAAAAAAGAFAGSGERVTGLLAADSVQGLRLYVTSFERDGVRSWLVLDGGGSAVRDRALVREAISISALCELAEEAAGGGDLGELRGRLRSVGQTEAPTGIAEAEAAALALEQAVQPPPRVASAAYLDRIGDATRRLERALGSPAASPFALAMQGAAGSVDELAAHVESSYKVGFL